MLNFEPVKPTAFDRALSAVSPERGLRRLAYKQQLNMFHYVAAKSGPKRKVATASQHQNPNNYANNQDRLKLIWQARDMEENSPIVAGILDKLCLFTTAKLAYQSQTGDPEFDKVYEDYFHAWARHDADATGRYTFRKIVELALRGMLRDGDHGLVISDAGSKIQLNAIEADRIGNPNGPQLTNKPDYVSGIMVDPNTGVPLEYEVYRRTALNQYSLDQKYPSDSFIFLADQKRVDAYRGISYFHAVLNHIKDLQDLLDYEKQGAKFASSFSGFITSANPWPNTGAGAFDTKATSSGPPEMSAQAGKVVRLGETESISFAPGVDRPSNAFLNLVETLEAQTASGLGLPIGFIKDFSRFGGVTARLESQLVMRAIWRWQDLLVDRVLDRVKNLVLAKGIANGHIEAHDNWEVGSWQFAAHLTADIGHEVNADLALNQAGAKPLRQIIEAHGGDFRETMEQNASEISQMRDIAARYEVPIELFVRSLPEATQMLAGMVTPPAPPTLGESVGDKGVKNIFDLLEKVGEGIIPTDAAVQTLVHTYGIPLAQAKKIVPKKASIDVNGSKDGKSKRKA